MLCNRIDTFHLFGLYEVFTEFMQNEVLWHAMMKVAINKG